MMSAASPDMCLSSQSIDSGMKPACNATLITLGLSAINTPSSGDSRFLS